MRKENTACPPKGGRTDGICYKSMRSSWTTRGVVVYGKTDHLTSTHTKSVHRSPSPGYGDGSPCRTRLWGLTRDQPSPALGSAWAKSSVSVHGCCCHHQQCPLPTCTGIWVPGGPTAGCVLASVSLCIGAARSRQGPCRTRASLAFGNPLSTAQWYRSHELANKCSSAISTPRPKFVNFGPTFCANPDLNE